MLGGKVDYALGSLGGSIVSSSETFDPCVRKVRLLEQEACKLKSLVMGTPYGRENVITVRECASLGLSVKGKPRDDWVVLGHEGHRGGGRHQT